MPAKRKYNFKAQHDLINTPDVESTDVKEDSQEQTALVKDLVNNIKSADTKVTKAFDIQFIPRDKLVFNKNNKYPMEDIESLASWILEYGLLHNIEVFYDESNDQYIVDAGERRTRAIDYLIKKYKDVTPEDEQYLNYKEHVQQFDLEGYPCKIVRKRTSNDSVPDEESSILDEIDTHIRLILSNETGRKHDAVRQQEQIHELDALLKKRNALLKKGEKINVNETLAETFGLSTKQVKNYKAISTLIPELKKLFEENHITLKDGANYAQLSEEEQRQLLSLIESGSGKNEIDALYKNLNELKKDISSREQDIRKLEAEKKAALEKVEEAARSKADLEKRLREQIEADNANEIDSLKEKLEAANTMKETYAAQLEDIAKKQEKEVADLKKKLEEKEQKQEKDYNIEVVKSAAVLESNISSMKVVIQNLNEAISNYEKVYEEDAGKNPTDYKSEIARLLEKLKI